MAEGHLRVTELVAATLPVAEAPAAYGLLRSPERPLAVLLDYGGPEQVATGGPRTLRLRSRATPSSGQVVLGVIGAGVFFRSVHLPNLRRHGGFFLKTVATRTGLHAHDLAVREGIPVATTDPEAVIGDPEIEAILIATRHDLHASLAVAAARAGKHVFVEKPLALTVEECDRVVAAVAEAGVLLTVGFNRRFAPLAHQAKALVEEVRGLGGALLRNAGPLPADHWLRDPEAGGGRLLGEGVHFFDFVRWLLRADPVAVHATAAGRAAGEGPDPESVASVVSFPDGSLAAILYASQGSPALPKERIEIFGGGRAIVLDDFAALEVHGVRGRRRARFRAPDKGHAGILADFHGALRGTTALGVTAQDGRWATWCAEQARMSLRGGTKPED
jgi:predicted dehydrogenase